MAINERLVHTASAAAAGTGNQEEGLILHLDANDVDSYDGDGTEWVDITNHEYTPATNVSEHFNTVLFNSTGVIGSQVEVDGVGFQPDLVWIKPRNYGHHHRISDSVRGVDKTLKTNTTDAELSSDSFAVLSFNTDGFDYRDYQESDETLVAWCFKAGGAAVSNTDGSITSQVSTNNDLGFSIVEFNTGTSHPHTVGHGLDSKPEMVITKVANTTSDWLVYHKDLSNAGQSYLLLNTTASVTDYGSDLWNYSNWDSTKIGGQQVLQGSSNDVIAYCFTSKRGVSEVGSYTGTGAAGNKVYTGFEPAFLIVKRATGGANSWVLLDNKRTTMKSLFAEATNTEQDYSTLIEFNSDGFTLKAFSNSLNNSSGTYIYYAVAKNTNETSLIDDTDLELHLDAASFPEKGEAGYSNTPTTWTALTGSNGTITGATFDSELGNWLDFNGSSDKVKGSISGIGSQLTMELWVSPNDFNGSENLLELHDSAISNSNNRIFFSSGSLYASKNGGADGFAQKSSINSVMTIGKWHHVAAVYDANSSIKLYVDGVKVAEDLSVSGTFNIADYSIAVNNQYTTGDRHFANAKISQVRAYSSALTQDQIRQNFNFTKNDYPNGFDGTISGATWNSGGYFSFDGSNDKITLPYTDNPSNATFSAWVNCNNVSTYNNFISKGYYNGSSDNNYLYLATYATPYPEFRVRLNGTSIAATSSVAISNNTWHHLVGTVSGTGDLQIYIDGTLTGSATGAPARNMTQSIIVGAYLSGAIQFFDGEMSKIKLYDKVLTSSEITALYNEGE